MQTLDAVVSNENVQKPLGNRQPWTQKIFCNVESMQDTGLNHSSV